MSQERTTDKINAVTREVNSTTINGGLYLPSRLKRLQSTTNMYVTLLC